MSEKELTGIEYLESLPDGCLFRWHDSGWMKSIGHDEFGWYYSDGHPYFRDASATDGQTYNGCLIATASKDTVTILWPKEEKVCEWVVLGDMARSDCGREVEDVTLCLGIPKYCFNCGGKIKVKESEAAPEGMVAIEIIKGKTVYGKEWFYYGTNDEEPMPVASSCVGQVADGSITTCYAKIENVLPPAPEGTVWYKPGPDDVWMVGDYPKYGGGWCSSPVSKSHTTDVGKAIPNRCTNHGFICRKPCTWTPDSATSSDKYWRCSCGYESEHIEGGRPGVCKGCKRPIIEAEPEPKLRYVECGEIDGDKVFKLERKDSE